MILTLFFGHVFIFKIWLPLNGVPTFIGSSPRTISCLFFLHVPVLCPYIKHVLDLWLMFDLCHLVWDASSSSILLSFFAFPDPSCKVVEKLLEQTHWVICFVYLWVSQPHYIISSMCSYDSTYLHTWWDHQPSYGWQS